MHPESAPTPTAAPAARRTALVVDDFPSVRFYHAHLLEKMGFKCSTAANGREALELLKKQPVDLLVVDIIMPEMSGEELIRSLRAVSTLVQLPVLVISSEPIGERIRRGRTAEAGPVGFVQKPLLPATILAEIEGLMREQLDGLRPPSC